MAKKKFVISSSRDPKFINIIQNNLNVELEFHPDDCCETHALCLVLRRYEEEAKHRGKCRLDALKDSYDGSDEQKDLLLKHLARIEKYYHVGSSHMSQMFKMVLDRIDPKYLQVLFRHYATAILDNPAGFGEAPPLMNLPSLFNADRYRAHEKPLMFYLLENNFLFTGLTVNSSSATTVLDPYSGYARYLNWTSGQLNFMHDKGIMPVFYFQDKDPVAAGMAVAYSILCKGKLGGVHCGDSVKSIFDGKMLFDRVIINRTFPAGDVSGIFESNVRDGLSASVLTSMEMLPFVQALNNLKEDGLALVLCSSSTLYKQNARMRHARSNLVTCVQAVIDLPPFLLNNPGDKAALVLLKRPESNPGEDKKKKKQGFVRMVDGVAFAKEYYSTIPSLPPQGDDPETRDKSSLFHDNFISKLAALVLGNYPDEENRPPFVGDVSYEAIADNGFSLSPPQYVGTTVVAGNTLTGEDILKETDKLIGDMEMRMVETNDGHEDFLRIAKQLIFDMGAV